MKPAEVKDFQVDRASPRTAGLALLGVLALVPLAVGVAFLMFAVFQRLTPDIAVGALQRARLPQAVPALEVDPRQDRRSIERRAEAHLSGYRWTNREAGLAQIPIERAMALQAARGWPDPAERGQ
jgi:hypothetical protein